MSIRKVSKGDPITAHWANSLIHAIETQSVFSSTNKHHAGASGKSLDFIYPAGFQITMTPRGQWTIEPGCIFINNELVVGKNDSLTANQTSLMNWSSACIHKGKKLPKWKIKGYIPRDYTMPIKDSKFWLIDENGSGDGSSSSSSTQGEDENPPENPPEGYTWWEQMINDVDEDGGTIKQIISGSIYISLPVPASSMRPFDVRITQVIKEETDGDGETEGEEEEEEKVEIEVASGWVHMPNKEFVMVPQRLKMLQSTTEPFYVILTLTRDENGTLKYNHECKTENQLQADGWTIIEAEQDESTPTE